MTESSYRQIVKSSALIGGSSGIDILLRIGRVKVLAVLLGPQGIGWLGIYSAIGQIGTSIAILGVETAAVRQIAHANESRGTDLLHATLRSMWALLLISGAVVALGMAAFASEISELSFGTDEHGAAIIIVASSVFFGCALAGFRSTIQGLRRIGDLALINVLGSLVTTAAVIGMVWIWRDAAVAPIVLVTALASAGVAWLVVRRSSGYPRVRLALPHREIAKSLLKLGSIFLLSAVAGSAIAYFTRAVVLRASGVDAAGYYQSASALAVIYTGFILQAMGSDFFPRLSGAKSTAVATRMVNEQIEVGLLMALPGVLATLALAPVIIRLFYSSEFMPAVEVLRWLSVGALLEVVTYPMGYILPARDDRRAFLATQIASLPSNYAFVWIGVWFWGLPGAGIGYCAQVLAYLFFIYTVVRHRAGFEITRRNLRLIGLAALGVIFVAGAVTLLSPLAGSVLGTAAAAVAALISLRALQDLVRFKETRFGQRISRWMNVR